MLMQATRLHGALPGAEIAHIAQLTAQTVSHTTKRLQDDGVLLRGTPPWPHTPNCRSCW